MKIKQTIASILFAVALTVSAFGQAGFTAVMVNTNGIIQRPTNFFTANNILTNQTGTNPVVFYSVLNQVNRVDWTANQWTVITNVGSFDVSDGRMILANISTNAGNSAIAYYGNNVGGHSFLNIDSAAAFDISSGAGLIFQGALSGSREGLVKRFVIRGVSSSAIYDDVGSLDRAGWAVEIRVVGGTNQSRLLVYSSSGLITSPWNNIPLAVNTEVRSFWTWRDNANTYVEFQKDFGLAFDTNPTITVTNIPGGTASANSYSVGIAAVIVSNTSSAPYFDIGAITETKNFNP